MKIEDVRNVMLLCKKAEEVHSSIRGVEHYFKKFENEITYIENLPENKKFNEEALQKIFDEVYDAILYLKEALDDLTSYAIKEY